MSLVFCSNGLSFLKLEFLKYPCFFYPSVITCAFLNFFLLLLQWFSVILCMCILMKNRSSLIPWVLNVSSYYCPLSIIYNIYSTISCQILQTDFINNV